MADAVGIDIIEIARIRKAVAQFGDRFVRRILGADEHALYARRADRFAFLAGRFAAKEAVVKALGHYLLKRPPWNQIEIMPDDHGVPRVHFSTNVRKKLVNLKICVSIAHDKTSAVATVTLTEEE